MSLRWHWGTKIALVYILFVCGTITMVAIAVRQRTDLVTPDYYARALQLDDRMAAVANVTALGDSFSAVQTEPDRLQLQWPHTPESGTITLYRAADAGADRTTSIAAVRTDRGAQQDVALTNMAPGAWKAQVTWTSRGKSYYAERELTIK